MKCKDCHACKKGFWASKPEAYFCIGVQEPFEISDINHDCTEYPEKNKEVSHKAELEDKVLTLIKDIYKFIGGPVDYAELISSPVPSSYGMYYVYTEPEAVLLDAAAKMIITLQEQIDESTKYTRAVWHEGNGRVEHIDAESYCLPTYVCSACKCEEDYATDYCPNCGAKMDLED